MGDRPRILSRPVGPEERRVIVDLVASVDQLIGSDADIWGHPAAARMLLSERWTVLGIFDLVSLGRAVGPSRVRSAVHSIAPPEELHALPEVVEHMLVDGRARCYWDSLMPDSRHPHRCPRCGLACYVGFREVECRAEGCK